MPSGAPPYAPDFGAVPPTPIGRDGLLSLHARRLTYPGGPHHVWALIGERGVGKTVVLTMLADRMRAAGWATLDYSATSSGNPVDGLLALLPSATASQWRDRSWWQALDRELTVQLNAGLGEVEGHVTAPARAVAAPPSIALRLALEEIGTRAKIDQTGLLITIDEAHRLGSYLETLGSIMQIVTKRHRQPVAWVLAGTRELSDLLLASGSFPERMQRHELAMLSSEESRLAIIEPAANRGVLWHGEAAGNLVEAAQGYPYFLQVGGYYAWQAEPSDQSIGLAAAAEGVRQIRSEADRLFLDRWRRLGPVQRSYVAAVILAERASGADGARTGLIAEILGRVPQQLTVARDSLINERHLLRETGRGRVGFALPLFGRWLEARLTQEPLAPEFCDVLPKAAQRDLMAGRPALN